MKDLKYYQKLAKQMVSADRERDRMMAAMDDMWHNRWGLPNEVSNLRWIHKVVSTDPHDAVRAGARVLSAVEPRIKLHPTAPNEDTRENADRIERALQWHFRNASRRRRANVVRDVVLSALLYDEVVAQVVYLPHQIDAVEAFKGNTKRLEAARRFGPFAILVRNPRDIHVRYSDWMPEAVLLKKVQPASEVIDFWGSRAGKLKGFLAKRENRDLDHVTVYDYMDLDVRVVWAVGQEGGQSTADADSDDGIAILKEKHELGFLPWVARVGGSTLENDPGHQRIPLLYSVYQAKQWDTQNVLETLMASEVIAYAAAPRLKIEGPSDNIEVDYGEPGRPAYVPPGHELNPLAPPGLDKSLAVISDRIAKRIGKSTVPRVLQTGDYPAGTAFATLNLATQSGIKSLTPYKELAEQALADIFVQMLNWVDHAGEPVVAYGSRQDDPGEQYVLVSGMFDVNQLYIDVELTADVPSDRMARINASAMAVNELGYSRARALEQIGENDPQVVMQQGRDEQLEAVELEIEKNRRLALGEVETERLVELARQGDNLGGDAEPAVEKYDGQFEEADGEAPGKGQGFDTGRGGSPVTTLGERGEG